MNRIAPFSRLKVMVSSVAVQAVIGYTDYATNAQLRLDIFYFIPVAITAWYLRRLEVLISVLIGTFTWGYVDIQAGDEYNNWAYFYWNILVTFGALLLIGLLVNAVRDNLKKTEAARQELAKALANLRQSTTEIEKLRGQFQVVCAWSKRIRVAGKWMTFEEFLKDHLQFNLTHGVSPEAMAQIENEIEKIPTPAEPRTAVAGLPPTAAAPPQRRERFGFSPNT